MRAMANVFEKDTNILKKYMKAFLGSCQKIVNAQVAIKSVYKSIYSIFIRKLKRL